MQSGALPSLKIGSDPLAKASGECVPVLGIRAENKLKADQAISFAAGRRLSRFGKFRQLAPVWHYPPFEMAVLEFEFRRVESVQSEELRCRIRGGVPTILQRATGGGGAARSRLIVITSILTLTKSMAACALVQARASLGVPLSWRIRDRIGYPASPRARQPEIADLFRLTVDCLHECHYSICPSKRERHDKEAT